MVPFSDSLNLRNTIILLKLARFVSTREHRTIRQDLIHIIPQEVDIRQDEWAKQLRFILKIPSRANIPDAEEFLKQISQLPGVVTIIIFRKQNFDFQTASLSELVKYTVLSIQTDKPVHIKFQALGSLPFHKRAVRERIHKKLPLSLESNESTFNVYLESKEEDDEVISRLGFIYLDEKQESASTEAISLDSISKMSVILYSPYTDIEIADFCRISLNFDFLQIIFSNENNKVPEILEETSKTTFKGIDKVKYTIIPNINEFITLNRHKYNFLGFSLHASKSAHNLKKALKSSNKTPCIVIGNEVRGLEYKTQKMIDMFKLGTGSSEPLRASHVMAYVLGMIA